ncbi:hypothetical protein PkoCFBP13504_17390 [Pseudomonas koreensis]|uniref:hypothetical protein n=1 Tax=Pseudomonas koreensis TaxID=198620 RepID=UPI0010BFE818|nr:hypothetical protein [Pseudomonas koreensis]TKJ82549.1 hypothetical protein PkoCFBP13504_17390 [Pseudomonas koreensis]
MISEEPVFGFGSDFSHNACVGENTGGDGDYGYVLGFAQASLVLIAATKVQCGRDSDVDEQTFVAPDTLIYPICFNARHHIELFLKRQIQRVAKLRMSLFNEKLLGEHSLGDLLDELAGLCVLADRRLPQYLQPLRTAIDAFAEIDPTGQVFRYHRSLNNEVHLKEMKHINLSLLERALKKLFSGTEEFDIQLDVLTYEYSQGTTTEKLSRSELQKLAIKLPPRSTWDEGSDFLRVKQDFMQEFGLSGRAFTKAVDLIQEHYEFAGFLGLELPIPYVDKNRLRRLVALDADEQLFEQLSRQELSVLDAILEVGHRDVYSEMFAYRIKLIEAGEESASFPHDVIRGITMHTQRFRQGLVKLGLNTVLVQVDNGLATRKKASKKSGEAAIAGFNNRVRKHFLGSLSVQRQRRPIFGHTPETSYDE